MELTWETGDDPPCKWVIGDNRPGASDYEAAHSALAPTMVYPLFETALRHEAGRTVDDHQHHVSNLWARFAAVAAENPNAWSRTAYTAEAIRSVSADNRMVCFPYPKRMCANIDVDQAAALLLCSWETARAAGVPDDRLVFLHAAAQAHDHYFFTERHTLTESPAIAVTVGDALTAAGITLDDVCGSTSTRASRRRCRSRRGRSAWPPTTRDRSRSPAAWGSRAVPSTTTPRTRSCGWSKSCEPIRPRSAARPRSAGTSRARGRHLVGVTAGARVPPGRLGRRPGEGRRAPRREPAGLVDTEVTLEATAVAFERDGSPSLGIADRAHRRRPAR